MSILASAVMALAAAQLNDANQTSYTNTVLLPHLKNAFKRLSSELAIHDLKYTEDTTSKIDVPASTVEIAYGGSPALPTDLIVPHKLYEAPDGGTTDQFQLMTYVDELPMRTQGTELLEWTWQEGKIKFVGATAAVDIIIEYEKLIAQVASENTSIENIDIDLFLSSQTAAYAALIVGGNAELAGFNQAIADDELSKYIRNHVKQRQLSPTRRLPYGYYRRNRRR